MHYDLAVIAENASDKHFPVHYTIVCTIYLPVFPQQINEHYILARSTLTYLLGI